MYVTKEDLIQIVKKYKNVEYSYFNLENGETKYCKKCSNINDLINDSISEIRVCRNKKIFIDIDIHYNMRDGNIYTGQIARFFLHIRNLRD